jgi:hypothetical protein
VTTPARRHYVPHDAPLKRWAIRGTPLFAPTWDEEDGRYWMMCLSPLRFDLLDRGQSVLLEPGYLTDGNSKPRAAWTAVGDPYSGRDLIPGVFHDAAYEAELFDRATCDWLYLDFQQDMGVSWSRRNTNYSGVRAGGWLYAWRHHTPESVAEARRQVRLVAIDAEPNFPATFMVSHAPTALSQLNAHSGKW